MSQNPNNLSSTDQAEIDLLTSPEGPVKHSETVHLIPEAFNVLDLLSWGYGETEIATQLGLTEEEVNAWEKLILQELDALTIEEAIFNGFKRGILAKSSAQSSHNLVENQVNWAKLKARGLANEEINKIIKVKQHYDFEEKITQKMGARNSSHLMRLGFERRVFDGMEEISPVQRLGVLAIKGQIQLQSLALSKPEETAKPESLEVVSEARELTPPKAKVVDLMLEKEKKEELERFRYQVDKAIEHLISNSSNQTALYDAVVEELMGRVDTKDRLLDEDTSDEASEIVRSRVDEAIIISRFKK